MKEQQVEVYSVGAEESFADDSIDKLAFEALLQEYEKLAERPLRHQQALATTNRTSIQFPMMTERQRIIYFNYLPNCERIEDYTRIIPLRVLDAAITARKQGIVKLVVLHKEGSPDPVLLGQTPNSNGDQWHMIARWGDELMSENELFSLLREEMLRRERAELEKRLATMDFNVNNSLNGVDSSTTVTIRRNLYA